MKPRIIPNSPEAVDDSLSTQVDDATERQYFRRSLLLIGAAFLVMLFFFMAAFFLAVRGAERTVVPQVVNAELPDALLKLQERELYPRLQMKYTGNPADKGMVIAQNPDPGLYVKAGRRITVTVSQGAVVDKVEDYVGKTLREVRGRLASLFSTFDPLLTIREPVVYVYDEVEAETVISQHPPAGTPLSEPVELIFIVSRGTLDRGMLLPDWTGWAAEEALASLAGVSIPFIFQEDGTGGGTAMRVTSQTPPAESEIRPGQKAIIRYSPPATAIPDSRYGLFDHVLPDYPVPVLLEVLVRSPDAEERMLFSMPHPGGRIAFPYVLPPGSRIILMINGVEKHGLDILSDS